MATVLIHFYLQHLKLYCLFLGNACKISSRFFQLGYCTSQALKSCFTYTPQISLLYDNIGEIIVSNILQAREGFNLLKFVCCLKLKRAWRAFSFKCSSEILKLPVEEIWVPKYVYIHSRNCEGGFWTLEFASLWKAQ